MLFVSQSAAVAGLSTAISCYTPTATTSRIFPEIPLAELITFRRAFFSRAIKEMTPVFQGDEVSFDDAITVSILIHTGTSEDRTHSHVPQWLSFLKFLVKQFNLQMQPEGFDPEISEERIR